jgi:hypothetical protein
MWPWSKVVVSFRSATSDHIFESSCPSPLAVEAMDAASDSWMNVPVFWREERREDGGVVVCVCQLRRTCVSQHSVNPGKERETSENNVSLGSFCFRTSAESKSPRTI